MYDQEKIVITAITTVRPGLISPPRQPSFDVEHAATTPTAIRIWGTASSTSARRESIVSTTPPKKPARRPTTSPIVRANPLATTPTNREVRAPYIVRTKRSRPAESAPNQNEPFGPRGTPNSSVMSLYVAFSGWPEMVDAIGPPKIATNTSTKITTPPASAAFSWRK